MKKCIGILGIVNKKPDEASGKINDIIAAYRDVVTGRLGIPKHEENMGLISLIVEGASDEIQAFEQELKAVDGIVVSLALSMC